MAQPKRKPSRAKTRARRAANSPLTLPQLNTCPQCAEPYQPHRACPHCGHYKNRQILNIETYD